MESVDNLQDVKQVPVWFLPYASKTKGAIMLLRKLREEVLEANLELVQRGLVLYTFGNASGVDREQGLLVIKP
jgi:hypothetical protein